MKRVLVLLIIMLASAFAQVVVAQDTIKAKSLPSVKIRGRHERGFQKLTSVEQSEVITADGLKGLACCNLGESFENSASVDVGYADAVSGSKQIQLLGLTGVYSLMMLENIPFLRGIAAPFGLGVVPGQWLESISVSKGAGTVKNGYESITGSINLEYEKPQRGNTFTLNLYENSDLKSEVTAKLNHQFGDHLSTGLYVYGAKNMMSVDHLGHDGFRDFPLQTQLNLLNRWLYQADNGFHSISLINYTYEDRLGGDMRFEKGMDAYDSIYGIHSRMERLFFSTKNGVPLSDKVSIGSQLSASYTAQSGLYGPKEYYSNETDCYANLLMDAEVGALSNISSGLSFRYSKIYEALGDAFWMGCMFDPDIAMVLNREYVPGAFVEYTFKADRLFTATAGLRYDYYRSRTIVAFHDAHIAPRHLVTPRIHMRWEPVESLIFRASAGRGCRTPNVVADNIGILASNRTIHVNNQLPLEDAWNGGINVNKNFALSNDRKLKLTADLYHTEFVSQLVADYDQSATDVYFYGLDGRSFSTVAQLDVNYEPVRNLEISLAGKYSNVKSTYHGVLMDKPFTSKWRALLVLTYHTRFDKWRFDLTTQINGPMRLPLNVSQYNGYSKPYVYMLGQVTRKFKHCELYGGVENITNYVQQHPIAGYDQPFSQVFDASVVFAPLMGRLFYLGFRYNVR